MNIEQPDAKDKIQADLTISSVAKPVTVEPQSMTPSDPSVYKPSRNMKYVIVALLFIVVILLRLQSENRYNATADLLSAANNASIEEITRLIQRGANVNAVDNYGKSPLMQAAMNNSNPEVLRVLIENGANVNTVNNSSRTPLMQAAMSNSNPEVLRVLIENGANVNTASNSNMTPLMQAAMNNSNPEILRILIESGADINAVNNSGKTPLMQAAMNNSNPEVLRVLLEKSVYIDAVDKDGMTPLLYAVEWNENPDILRVLIENGANVNAVNINGVTPLMIAASHNSRLNFLRILIENGADINAADYRGWTPLMWAANNPEVLRVLLESGADLGIRDKEGKTVLEYAENRNRFRWTFNLHLPKIKVGDEVNLNIYHPWSDTAQLPLLDSPVSFRIDSDYPKLDGATSAYPIYAAVANEIFNVSNKTELQHYLFCSRTENAYRRLINGEIEIIFTLQPSDEQLQLAKEAGVELHFTPIAKDAFVFFVNSRNPVSGLSVDQIRNIYLNKITNWQEVGGNDREILTYQRQANSGSQTAMLKEVMKGEELPPPQRLISLMGQIVIDVATYRDKEESIGYSFRFFTEEMMRDVFEERKKEADNFQLMLDLIPANDPDSQEKREKYQLEIQNALNPVKLLAIDGIAPSEENIRNGTYPFTVDLYAVTAGSANPHIQDLIVWLLSPQGQELIEKTGYVGAVKNRN